MSAHWPIGMEVECIDDGIDAYGKRCLVLNQRYRVSRPGAYHIEVSVFPDVKYRASRFRPVQTRTTDISIFTALLNPTKEETFRELEAEILDYEPVEVPFR